MPVSTCGTVYMIPCFLDENNLETIPAYISEAVKDCQAFFVENERSARRYLKQIWKEIKIDELEWFTIHKAEEETRNSFVRLLKAGKTIGIISEAGCPGIADPGQLLVSAAQEMGAKVKPLVGPSAMLLALMASGLNGQQFTFNGYLPIDQTQRTKSVKDLEAESARLNCTQVFIETPYRNNQLIDTLLAQCRASTKLCIAVDITGKQENIRTMTISEWKKNKPNIHKRPAIFCLLGTSR